MKERIKTLRNALGLTQQEFADKLGIKRATIGNYEAGRNIPVDSVISLICDRCKVSENWLRYGTGEMFIDTSEYDDIRNMVETLLADESADLKRRLVAAVLRLSPDQIARAVDWIKDTFGLVDASDIGRLNAFSESELAEIDAAGESAKADKRAEILDKSKVKDA